MVALLKMDYNTRYAEFTYDNWETDGSKLPTTTKSGTDNLANIGVVSMGSIAIGTDGGLMILHGGKDRWIQYGNEV